MASSYGSHATVGLQFALTILAMGALGWWLDSKFDTQPWLLFSGAGLGMVGGFLSLIQKFPAPSGGSKDGGSQQDL